MSSKDKAATEAGFVVKHDPLAADSAQSEVESVVEGLNADDAVDVILVQAFAAEGLDSDAVIDRIAPEKDVDGLTAANVARLSMGGLGSFRALRPAASRSWIGTASISPGRTWS